MSAADSCHTRPVRWRSCPDRLARRSPLAQGQRLQHVRALNPCVTREIGDGPGHPHYALAPAGRQRPDRVGRCDDGLRILAQAHARLELARHSRGQTWWLGYLDTSPVTNVVFHDAPRVKLYANWDYVLVEAGPQQAAAWRAERPELKGPLPDLIFPADRSWLFCTLWDDDWSCIGGSEQLIADFENDPAFKLSLDPGPRLARVGLGDDATPDGHQSY